MPELSLNQRTSELFALPRNPLPDALPDLLPDPLPPRQPACGLASQPTLSSGRTVSIDSIVRHRTTRMQGQALEILGHAIEYLVDSRLVQFEQESTRADGDAVRLLIGASREVFAESPTYVPLGDRIRRWLYDRVMAAAA